METRKGWINIHYDVETGRIYCSQKPYDSEKDAKTAIFIGGGLCKIACIEIEYPYLPVVETMKITNNK